MPSSLNKLGKPARRNTSRASDELDVHIGRRLRLRRQILGVRQQDLAAELGITFQQLQKYETGETRISASRLFRMTQVLDVSPAWFYADLDNASSMPSDRSPPDASAHRGDGDGGLGLEVEALLEAYHRITDPRDRSKVFELLRRLAEE